MLDDCFQLISLAYMTVGKNHEPPAVYVRPTSPLIDHLLTTCHSYSYISTAKVHRLMPTPLFTC